MSKETRHPRRKGRFLRIGKLMRICKIHRTSLYRLEQRGLITPHRILHSGWRYYTWKDVARINRLRMPVLLSEGQRRGVKGRNKRDGKGLAKDDQTATVQNDQHRFSG